MIEEEIETALTPFGQVGSAMTRPHEGTGLGLPLATSFVEMHGGELTVESARGKGTTVTILLPPERSLTQSHQTVSPAYCRSSWPAMGAVVTLA